MLSVGESCVEDALRVVAAQAVHVLASAALEGDDVRVGVEELDRDLGSVAARILYHVEREGEIAGPRDEGVIELPVGADRRGDLRRREPNGIVAVRGLPR